MEDEKKNPKEDTKDKPTTIHDGDLSKVSGGTMYKDSNRGQTKPT